MQDPPQYFSLVTHVPEVESAGLIKTGTEAEDVICI